MMAENYKKKIDGLVCAVCVCVCLCGYFCLIFRILSRYNCTVNVLVFVGRLLLFCSSGGKKMVMRFFSFLSFTVRRMKRKIMNVQLLCKPKYFVRG